jgi:tRNA uridine 5-carboxymethylaminomethyl modification enzyme
MKVAELAKRHRVALADLLSAAGIITAYSADSLLSADLEIKYSGYFDRERAQADRMKLMGDFAIPSDFAFDDLKSLSYEARQKLTTIQPRTLAQASRIPGVSPSDIQNLVIEVEKKRSRSTVS